MKSRMKLFENLNCEKRDFAVILSNLLTYKMILNTFVNGRRKVK